MCAGEAASATLEEHGLLNADAAGRGEVDDELCDSLLKSN